MEATLKAFMGNDTSTIYLAPAISNIVTWQIRFFPLCPRLGPNKSVHLWHPAAKAPEVSSYLFS